MKLKRIPAACAVAAATLFTAAMPHSDGPPYWIQWKIDERALLFTRAEGFLPAPESAYSVCCAIDEALKCKEAGEEKVIAFNVSGHGFMDIDGYREVLNLPAERPSTPAVSNVLGI